MAFQIYLKHEALNCKYICNAIYLHHVMNDKHLLEKTAIRFKANIFAMP